LALGLHGLGLGKTATSGFLLALLVAGIGQGGAECHAPSGIATVVGVVHRAFGVGHGQRDAAQAQLQFGKIAVAGGCVFPVRLLHPHLRPSPHRFQPLRQPGP
jgi:hypothetical protein